jgi:hypothetical protein
MEGEMAAIVRTLSRTFPDTKVGIDILKVIVMFCGAGLVASLLAATYGLDLSSGFF